MSDVKLNTPNITGTVEGFEKIQDVSGQVEKAAKASLNQANAAIGALGGLASTALKLTGNEGAAKIVSGATTVTKGALGATAALGGAGGSSTADNTMLAVASLTDIAGGVGDITGEDKDPKGKK